MTTESITSLSEVGEYIAWVAASCKDHAEFARRAQIVATKVSRNFLPASRTFFHESPLKPSELKDSFEGLGEWMAICQAAIFEVAYYLREHSLPFLYEVAFGKYDWTQANATEILCRLALEGVETQKIGEEIAWYWPQWRLEQIERVRTYVAKLAIQVPVLQEAYDQLIDEFLTDDSIIGFEFIWALGNVDPQRIMRHVELLRQIMQGKGLSGAAPYDCIRACVLLWKLMPGDVETRQCLEAWAQDPEAAKYHDQIKTFLALPSSLL